MSAERRFVAEVAGINAEVLKPQSLALGGVGLGCSPIHCGTSGELLLGITVRHADGTVLTALLDEEKIFRIAEMMADFIEALPAIRSEARH